MMLFKRPIRRFSIWLRRTTDAWVVPPKVYRLMSQQSNPAAMDEATQLLIGAETRWPNDPEVTHAEALLSFLSGED